MGGVTLETTPAQLLSDHSQLQPTSLGVAKTPLQSKSPLVKDLKSFAFVTLILIFYLLLMFVSAVSPPVNVEATQASASAPVEVSWSPPSDGSATITAYRIFYGNGENVSVPSIVTSIILSLNEDSVGQTVSLRSETDQLTSQLITVTITAGQI